MNLHSEANLSAEARRAAYINRQEWAEKYLNERHDPAALSLDECGLIRDCSNSLESLFGFGRSDLLSRHVSVLLPQLAGVELVKEGQVDPLLKYLCRCGQLYQAQNRQGENFASNLSIVCLENKGQRVLRMIVRPSAGAGARPG
ncbi:MAG: hypothetical protein Q7U91_03905 [Sideroxyarcus sp.]|nr:hypothetical protein [Sideroxyarcus sp.]